jgi:hypothetical protein
MKNKEKSAEHVEENEIEFVEEIINRGALQSDQ